MGVERHLHSTSEEATEALAAALGEVLPSGSVLALIGDLGAGKTAFVRGLARGLGIESGISSPTYTLMQAHEGGRLPLYHFDAWMEGREKAWLAEGGGAWLRGEGVAVIEWAGRVEEWLPSPRIEVRMTHAGWTERGLRIAVVGGDAPDLEGLLAQLNLPSGVEDRDPASSGFSENGPSS